MPVVGLALGTAPVVGPASVAGPRLWVVGPVVGPGAAQEQRELVSQRLASTPMR